MYDKQPRTCKTYLQAYFKMLNGYLDKTHLSLDFPLFCQLSKAKYDYKARAKGLSYTRLRELVIEALI